MISNFKVDREIFDSVPDYVRLVVIAEAGQGAGSDDLAGRLSEESARLRPSLSAVGDLPEVAAWRRAFRAVGLDPKKHRPALEAVLTRIRQGKVPSLGNPLVDAGTLAAVRLLAPVGVHVVDDLASPAALERAAGGERFVTLRGEDEAVGAGEVVYRSGDTVLTRRWCWRQGGVGSVAPGARWLAVNVDLLDGQNAAVAARVTSELLTQAGARVIEVLRLDAANPEATATALAPAAGARTPDPGDGDLLTDLDERGLIHTCSDPGALRNALEAGPVTLYCGIDPSAPSLHVGSLLVMTTLRRFLDAGHVPIVVVGGATGSIGDPSGRSKERTLLDLETLHANRASLRKQIERLLPSSRVTMVDNLEWTADVPVLEFLREIGKHFNLRDMLARESVKRRLGTEQGITFTEFSYSLLQSFDFDVLYREYGCTLQVGGSDQWGNIVAGIELIRRRHQGPAYGLVWPLLQRRDGEKFGKTADGAVWLDPQLTSPWRFWQYWFNLPDREVGPLLYKLSRRPVSAIRDLAAQQARRPEERAAQRALADEMTGWVHGEGSLRTIHAAADALFGDEPTDLGDAAVVRLLSAELPSTTVAPGELSALDAAELVVCSGAETSRSAAARLAASGGLRINGEVIVDVTTPPASIGAHGVALIRRGKKRHYLVVEGGRRGGGMGR